MTTTSYGPSPKPPPPRTTLHPDSEEITLTTANHEHNDLDQAHATGTTPLRAVPGGRRRIKVGSDPHTRELAREIDGRCLPETYVHEGSPVVSERVSGTAQAGRG